MLRLALAALLFGAGCSGSGSEVHEALGTVTEVDAESRQVVVDHEDVPDLMPAMTMSFDVPDAAVLDKLRPGQRIRFGIEHGEGRFRIVSAEVIGEGEAGRSGGGMLAGVRQEAEEAPPFALTDQDGARVTLAELRGRVLLLDFVYTNCPGPCPILTSIHAQVQRELPEDVRDRVHFVSISLDPARDTPAAMRAYGESRGADLSRWSFLTGTPEQIRPVLSAYGVGTAPGEGLDEISHLVVTFLIDPEGRIVERYFGVEHGAAELLGDVVARARAADGV